jgi:hypothetical protein
MLLLGVCGLMLAVMMIGFFSTAFSLENALRASTSQSVGR